MKGFLKTLLLTLLIMLSFVLCVQPIKADVADEQESIAESKADDAVNSLTDKGNKAEERYDELMNDIKDGKIGGKYDGNWWKGLIAKYYNGYQTFKYIAPFLVVISEALGFLIVWISKYNKKLKRRAIIFLNIALPILIIVTVFVLGYFNSQAF